MLVGAAAWLTACGPRQAPGDGASGETTTGSDTTAEQPAGDSDTTGSPPPATTTEHATTEAASTGSSVTSTGGEGESCDFYAQNCAAGFKCAPRFDGLGEDLCLDEPFVCVPLFEAPVGLGARCRRFDGVCGGRDECGPGLFCAYVDEDNVFGTCMRICELGDGIECPDESETPLRIGGVVSVCIKNCEPLADDCPRGMTCAILPGPEWLLGCAALDPNAGGLKSPCESHDDCLPGFTCAFAPSFECVPYCELGVPGACDALPGSECQEHELVNVALCLPP
ncbi:hypothetical protein [Nannocystis punicea]|uniref:Uncharacterized protein n=1 Tax=Nannocystis punicea TaxID=2995304 RepID=A0ABY7H8S0_9BACT|nr:hypothetical protein [Nannocystis poenicansa]WAS95669.1 hypothetical protein O0S08_05860 [Nannocystis poenicansa]